MAVYIIGDLHLSQTVDKSMEIFGGWENYVERTIIHWNDIVSPSDTVILAGDTSWGMTLESALEDFKLIDKLNGTKYLIKGNHDYWWNTRAKTEKFWRENGLTTLNLLYNSAIKCGELVICGSRGWLFEKGEPHDKKIVLREALRLEQSIKEGMKYEGEKVAVLHYPPIFGNDVTPEIIDVLKKYEIKRCYYGHIHGIGHRYAVEGSIDGIYYKMISADYLRFRPYPIN